MKSKLRTFLISFSLVFVMTVAPHLKTVQTRLVNPLPQRQDVLQKLKPALDQKKDSFQLKKQIIEPVSAGSDFDAASAYGVVDFNSGEVIASKNLSQRLPIASLTKIMTAVVALDLADPSEQFTVSEQAASQPPTKVMLRAGEKYSLKDLIKFMLITSANDSAQVIEEGIDAKYGQGTFVRAMNMKAQDLGLKNTSFSSPQGYDGPQQFSSVEDLTILSHYALSNYPLIKQIVSEDSEDMTNNNQDLRFYLNNWNGLLDVYPGVFGIKIGNTDNAGYTTIVGSERGGRKVLAVVLGAPGVLERDLWASELLDLGFQKLGLDPINVTQQQLMDKYATWKYFS